MIWSSSGWELGRRGIAPLVMLVACVLIASSASAGRGWEIWDFQELQDEPWFESGTGVPFSDFNFSSVGDHTSVFEEHFVRSHEHDFLRLPGFGKPPRHGDHATMRPDSGGEHVEMARAWLARLGIHEPFGEARWKHSRRHRRHHRPHHFFRREYLTVPEPTSGMLVGMGLGVALIATRRRS